jgi:hypothetical protein
MWPAALTYALASEEQRTARDRSAHHSDHHRKERVRDIRRRRDPRSAEVDM